MKDNDLHGPQLRSGTLWLRTILRKNGIAATDEQLSSLDRYVGILLDWNKKINLISRKDEEHVWENHILHSLSVLLRIRFPIDATVLDLGTGGGLPGIPLRILVPGIRVTLLDSIQKKVTAVRDMVDRLSLSGVTVVCGRAEVVGKQAQHHQKYDVVLVRGVAQLPELIEHARLFLKKNRDRMKAATITVNPEDAREQVSLPALIAFKGGMLDGEVAKARRMSSAKSIRTLDLVFQGSEELSQTEKKIVVVEF